MIRRRHGAQAVAALTATLVLSACLPGRLPAGGRSGNDGGIQAAATAQGPTVGDCAVFPATNAWNQDVSKLPVHKDSAKFVASIGTGKLHPDFGGDGEYGIPYLVVGSTTPKQAIHYTDYGDESDRGPFPIPPTAPIEGGASSSGDRHVIVVQRKTCMLYELYRGFWRGNRWDAASGAKWDLKLNARRPLGWTSADAAGLPILPGLVRYGEVSRGSVQHALRFTVPRTQKGYVFPATHYASSSTNAALPPMGLRLRLKASYSLSRFHGQTLVIMKALKKYGMIVADNGSPWYITGAADPRWNDDDLGQLKTVPGSAFEVVNTGPIRR